MTPSELDRRVWAFLPGRRTRGRTTVAPVVALHVGATVTQVMESLLRMERAGHVIADPRSSWHRGMPLAPEKRAEESPRLY